MTTKPTPDIAELRRLWTEGAEGYGTAEWEAFAEDDEWPWCVRVGNGQFFEASMGPELARLIAAAVNALPGLLDRVEELEGALKKKHQWLKHLEGIVPPCDGDAGHDPADFWPVACHACIVKAALQPIDERQGE